jgi:hypothetical protein
VCQEIYKSEKTFKLSVNHKSLTTDADFVPILIFQKEGKDGNVGGDGGIPAASPTG